MFQPLELMDLLGFSGKVLGIFPLNRFKGCTLASTYRGGS